MLGPMSRALEGIVVTNHAIETVYVSITGEGWVPLGPGASTPPPVDADAVALPVHRAPTPLRVWKVVDGMDVTVQRDYRLRTTISPQLSLLGRIRSRAGQAIRGGWVRPQQMQGRRCLPPGYDRA